MTKPFNMGINAFKKMLKETALSKSDRNKAVKAYKDRITERLKEITKQYVLDNNPDSTK